MSEKETFKPGDVFQINEKHGRNGWIGAFVLAEEIRHWGIVGFVSHIETHDKQSRAYIRLEWEHIDYVGKAALILGNKPDDTEAAKQDE